METAEADRTETALADGGEGPRDLFGRGVRLVVSYIRMHPRPFAIAVIGPGKGRGQPQHFDTLVNRAFGVGAFLDQCPRQQEPR